MDMNGLNSARAVADAYKKEECEQRIKEQEGQFNKSVSLETLNELKRQNALLIEQKKQSQIELEQSKKTNKTNLIWAIISTVVAVLSLLATVIIAIVK